MAWYGRDHAEVNGQPMPLGVEHAGARGLVVALRDVGFEEQAPAPSAPLPPAIDQQLRDALEALGYAE